MIASVLFGLFWAYTGQLIGDVMPLSKTLILTIFAIAELSFEALIALCCIKYLSSGDKK
jgi:hypothetical protein